MFWEMQEFSKQKEYVDLLEIVGSMSSLFSDNSVPYLYYRAHENLFCYVFNAKNLSRGDISFDALKGNIGIGLKTFLHGNGKTFQKIAEFNSNSDEIRALTNYEDIVVRIAELRNKRLDLANNITGSRESLYHLVTREEGKMNIIESPMEKIDINSIKIPNKQHKNTIKFEDKHNEYSFSLSKNTLLKRFNTSDDKILLQFQVEILDNPFEILKKIREMDYLQLADTTEFIVLPLYSQVKGDRCVPEKSGLNQWNASGRLRHPDEVYIRIPSWIHDTFDDFFVYTRERKSKSESGKNHPSFEVELPSGEIISCKVAQAGGKALMSDPNRKLGNWILRDVLKLDENSLATIEILDEVGIDSVKLTKESDDYYYLDFMESGSYELFEENNRANKKFAAGREL